MTCACSAGYPKPEGPGSFDTFVEFPYALYLSPTLWVAGEVLTRYDTVFENNITPLTTNGVTDLFCTSMVRRPFFQIGDTGPFSTPNQLDQPLDFAALWSDDLALTGRYTSAYHQNYDVTLWQYIEYGVPIQ